jgi:uncharacterized protein (DUF885 family)
MPKLHLAPLPALFLSAACSLGGVGANTYVPSERSDGERLGRFLEEVFQQRLDADPELASRLGDRRNQGRWTDRSSEAADLERQHRAAELLRLRREFDRRGLDLEDRIVHRSFEIATERSLAAAAWRMHECTLPASVEIGRYVERFLTEVHRIESAEDAQAYVARLRGLPVLFAQVIANLEAAAANEILPARATLAAALEDCRRVLGGAPFVEDAEPCVFLAHIEKELDKLTHQDPDRVDSLLASTRSALLEAAGPAYHELERGLEALFVRATEDRGVWRLPRGEEFYAFLLARCTSTPENPVELHGNSQNQVGRVEQEIRGQMKRMGIEESLDSYLTRLRAAPAGVDRQAALESARNHYEAIRLRMDEILVEALQGELTIREREPLEHLDGPDHLLEPRLLDRNHTSEWILDLDALARVPPERIEVLTYHRTIPGEHLAHQLASEPSSLPRLLRASPEPAATEGWAAYAEVLPRELGFYVEPAAEMARLLAELDRHARVVVDTGLHALRWSTERAREFLLTNTAETEAECDATVEQILRAPGAAASSVVGAQQILELRARAKRRLGASFDLREFHAVLLHAGALPLPVLGQRIDAWIAAELP